MAMYVPPYPSFNSNGSLQGNVTITGFLTEQSGSALNLSPGAQVQYLQAHSGPTKLLTENTSGFLVIDIGQVYNRVQVNNTLEATLNLKVDGILNYYNGQTLAGNGLPSVVAAGNATGQTATVTVSWTPPASSVDFEASVYVNVTTAGTSTIPEISYYNSAGTQITTQAIPMVKLAGTTILVSLTATGEYCGFWKGRTDNSAHAITITIARTGSTFNYDADITNKS